MSFKTLLRTAITAGGFLLLQGGAWAIPFPLNKIPVPEPANLSQFVKDKGAAIRLGKALFWDMQAGSDGVQACASCHFSAGADSRLTSQLNPGPTFAPASAPAFEIGSGQNYTLLPADFPFFQVSPPDGRLTTDELTGEPDDPNTVLVRDSNDIGGSQGITLTDFLAINEGDLLDSGTPRASLLFGASRQVTGRNAPSVINAVFNFTNFWDGSAHNIFNGETPYGPLDVDAGIWVDDGASPGLVKEKIALSNASLASQATGPPVSEVMMSFAGRSFPELGRKMLSLPPLDLQLVHPDDGVLGALSRADLEPDGSVAGGSGLSTSYRELIEEAFQDTLWSSEKSVTLNGGSYRQIEANFPLFWGLSLQLYQATLVSDRTPFDRFLGGNGDALSAAAQNGYLTFADKCAICHAGSEMTGAAVGSSIPLCTPPDCNPPLFGNNTTHTLIRAELDPEHFEVRLADAGFYNLGVRPTGEDLGRGAHAPIDNPFTGLPFPLSFTRLAQTEGLPFVTPMLPAGAAADLPAALDGAFKTPGLRNVELTAPYFHNGSMLTLEQVVEFYARGGNFPNNAELALNMQPVGGLRGNEVARAELVEFLKSLTDERVRNQTAPFDHPQLFIPSGDAAESMIALAPTGGGPAAQPPLLAVDPFASRVTLTALTFSGTVAPGSTVEVRVNARPPRFAAVTGGAWSVTVTSLPVGNNTVSFTAASATGGVETQNLPLTVLPVAVIRGAPAGGTNQTGATLSVSGAGVASYRFSLDGSPYGAETPVATPVILTSLSDGSHTVNVLAADALGNRQPEGAPASATWIVKATPPVLTLAPTPPTRVNSLTIGGTVELGSVPQVVAAPPARAGAVRSVGGAGTATWSCDITGLAEGGNAVTVTARDFVFNTTVVTGTITLDTVPPTLTLDPVPTPARASASQLLAGGTEAGIVPGITVAGGAPAAADVAGGSWSYRLSGLSAGVNRIAVSASDAAGNTSSILFEVELLQPDGNLKGSGEADISDALTALRVAVGLVAPTPRQLLRGDVAPLLNGVPDPDDRIEIADALTILRKVVGLLSF